MNKILKIVQVTILNLSHGLTILCIFYNLLRFNFFLINNYLLIFGNSKRAYSSFIFQFVIILFIIFNQEHCEETEYLR